MLYMTLDLTVINQHRATHQCVTQDAHKIIDTANFAIFKL
jgi:hypothetical protein